MTPAFVEGRATSLDEAAEAAASVLGAARLPLVYGLVESTVEAQREAARLAVLLRGVVDSATSVGQAAALDAFTRLGLLTTSLGELRRADLVVIWGCDPEVTLPGFVERYAPARAGCVRVAVDLGSGRGPGGADERFSLPADREIEALLVLRAFVRGRRVEPERLEAFALPIEALRVLARRLTACSNGVLLYEGDPPLARRDPLRPAALTAIAQDVPAPARLRTIGLQGTGNPVGAENVLTWQTGFPFAISFARGFPRHDPAEFSGEGLLARGEADAVLVVGVDPSQRLSPQALRQLGMIPIVALGEAVAPGMTSAGVLSRAKVQVATAPFAATSGRVFRMDGIALRHEPSLPSPLPSEATVMARIAAAVRARMGAAKHASGRLA
jgi:formylmethanofuran dehydrogenase subunit B